MRSRKEIERKMDEITLRIFEEKGEVATRAACERDALEWVLGQDVALHDMSTLEFKEDGSYVKIPWDGKS